VNKSLNILICPLEWGLGHAARMIPVAKLLKDMGHNVIIASGNEHLALFKNELPGLQSICFTGFKPSYSSFLPQYLSLLLKVPLLLYHIIREHNTLKRLIKAYNISIVISDNRFGLWNRNVTSVYVTHMPRIPLPSFFRFLEPVGIMLHRIVIKKYNYCWIPDLPGDLNLSGRLSHGIRLQDNTRFTGILSRFGYPEYNSFNAKMKPGHFTLILSGPEPQREILRQKLVSILIDKPFTTFIFGGNPDKTGVVVVTGNIHYFNHLPAKEMAEIIQSSKCVITRSGYTTIMELISMGVTAVLIPTPGQTEQEYLSGYLSEKGWFTSVSQKELYKDFSLPSKKADLRNQFAVRSEELLKDAVFELLEYEHGKRQCQKTGKEASPHLGRSM